MSDDDPDTIDTPPMGTRLIPPLQVRADVEITCPLCGRRWMFDVESGTLSGFVGEAARQLFRVDTYHQCAAPPQGE